MALAVEQVGVDALDPRSVAAFWAELLGWVIDEDDSDDDEVYVGPADGSSAPLGFFRVPDDKAVKNRLHLDLRPDDQEAEVSRALGLGARRADIGQGEQTWVVLADPEGNEFCILRNRPSA